MENIYTLIDLSTESVAHRAAELFVDYPDLNPAVAKRLASLPLVNTLGLVTDYRARHDAAQLAGDAAWEAAPEGQRGLAYMRAYQHALAVPA